MTEIFSGKDGFYWWFGTVEDNGDPMGMGRCRVRIAGWHNPDAFILETRMLPWAHPITPITNSAVAGIGVSPIGPQPGTRVFGWFLDGLSGQYPVMLGTVPGGSEYEYKRAIEAGATPWQPSTNEEFSNSPSVKEGDCPSSDDEENTRSNIIIPDQRLISIDSSEWIVPFTGFISSAYNEARGSGTHNGVDICPAGFVKQTDPGAPHLNGRLRGQAGLPVYAAASGEVVYIWKSDRGQRGIFSDYDVTGPPSRRRRSYGNAVAIRHTLSTGTYTTIYAHLGISQDPADDIPGAGINIKKGDKVLKGQQIGTVGRSHVWDSPTHLHFEIRIGKTLPKANNHINPGRIFPQMAHKHTSFLSKVNTQHYNVNVLFDEKFAPVKAGTGPVAI